MDRMTPLELEAPKVYFTETDPLLLTPINSLELSEKLKILCILNETVVIAATHLLESQMVRKVFLEKGITNLMPLLNEGIIVPALRDECDSFKELVRIKQENPQSERFYDKYENEIGSLLDDNTLKVVKWNAPVTSEEFKESLIKIIDSSNFRKKLAVNKESVDALIEHLTVGGSLSRSIVEQAIKLLPEGKRRDRVRNLVNLSYYLSGAYAVQCDPVVHHNDLYGLWDKFQIAPKIPSNQYTSFYNDIELFKRFLKDFAVDESVLIRLDADTILEIRNESITKSFRRAYVTVISEAAKGRLSNESVDRYNEMKDSLLRLMDEAASQNMTRRQIQTRKASKIIKTASVSSLITGIASFVPLPEVSLPAGLIGLALWFVDPLVGKFYKSRKSEFAIFADTIREYSLRQPI
ncbi:hypothetical protein HYR99_33120 [Candidatus Poribacteria bacterium]|nr:hypothetical protein [Candidatus Poribacteria bacterium]